MFCPYLIKSSTVATIINKDVDGDETGSIIFEHYGHYDCVREECGAWYDGKCNFKN